MRGYYAPKVKKDFVVLDKKTFLKIFNFVIAQHFNVINILSFDVDFIVILSIFGTTP